MRSPSEHEEKQKEAAGKFLLGSSAFKTSICKEVYGTIGGDETVRSAAPYKKKKYKMTALELASHLFKNSGNIARESIGMSASVNNESKFLRQSVSKEVKKRKKSRKQQNLELDSPKVYNQQNISQGVESKTTKSQHDIISVNQSNFNSYNPID